MIQSNLAPLGMVVTPHHLASESALAILREGGDAITAMVAAAATIAVVYPHMNSLGGDSFWLIVPPNSNPIAIDASGKAGSLANSNFYKNESHIPYRGPKSAITVAGTISGWQEALKLSQEWGAKSISISRILRDAIRYAADGIPVTKSQYRATIAKQHELQHQPGFSTTFLPNNCVPAIGSRFIQPALANTLNLMSQQGLRSFYKGEIAHCLYQEMKVLGMPITLKDLHQHRAYRCIPLHLKHSTGDIWNLRPPTQGLISLAILGIIDHLNMKNADEVETIHRIVESTKKAFILRDKYITDPRYVKFNVQKILNSNLLSSLASQINDQYAAYPWEPVRGSGDTVWMGIIDKNGLAVSFIQSIYFEFGSGVVLLNTGITWQNRGAAFNLKADHLLSLKPGKKPFHTLNPAAARLKDGRIMVYGSMGGDGQPQTQAAIFTRYVIQGMPLQEAISAPRWLLGRTWGELSDSLKLESRITSEKIIQLRKRGHNKIDLLSDFSEIMGHAGIVVKNNNGMLEGAFDPRSNGSAAGF